jgi:tetratricopeptide (TPR) repeat protein
MGDAPTALARIGQLDLAIKALKGLRRHASGYTLIFREFALHDHVRAGNALDDLAPGGTTRMYALIGLAEAAFIGGRRDDASTLLARAHASIPKPPPATLEQAITQIAQGMALLRQPEKAAHLVSTMIPESRHPYALSSVAETLALSGQPQAAKLAATTAIEMAERLTSDRAQASAHSWIAHRLAQHTDLAGEATMTAERALDHILAQTPVPAPEAQNPFQSTLARVIGSLALAGKLAAAKSVLTSHQQLLGAQLLDVAKDLALAGHLGEAEGLLDRSPQNWSHFARHVVTAVAAAGRPDDVRELAATIESALERATAQLALGYAYLANGNRRSAIERADAAVDAARSAGSGASVVADASLLLARCGELEHAAETAVEAAGSPGCTGHELRRCAETLWRCERPGSACRVLAAAWCQEHSPHDGWSTLVEISSEAALKLAMSRWTEPNGCPSEM